MAANEAYRLQEQQGFWRALVLEHPDLAGCEARIEALLFQHWSLAILPNTPAMRAALACAYRLGPYAKDAADA